MQSENITELPGWVPQDVDINRPNIARIYDYLLGGYHNFEVDRLAAQHLARVYPDLARSTHMNRAFVRRVVNYLLDQGLTQIIDIGAGIPTVGHVHEIAWARQPACRIVYVDIDPVAVAHSHAILAGQPRASAILADARDPQYIFDQVQAGGLLDLTQPVGALFTAILHFIPDLEETRRLIWDYAARFVPGSYIAFSHGTTEKASPEVVEGFRGLSKMAANPVQFYDHATISGLFAGFELVPPGIVFSPLWRPEGPDDIFLDDPARGLAYAGVLRISGSERLQKS
jgi:hypothetical protein